METNIMGTILWRPYHRELILATYIYNIMETILWKPNYEDLILWKAITETLYYIYIYIFANIESLY